MSNLLKNVDIVKMLTEAVADFNQEASGNHLQLLYDELIYRFQKNSAANLASSSVAGGDGQTEAINAKQQQKQQQQQLNSNVILDLEGESEQQQQKQQQQSEVNADELNAILYRQQRQQLSNIEANGFEMNHMKQRQKLNVKQKDKQQQQQCVKTNRSKMNVNKTSEHKQQQQQLGIESCVNKLTLQKQNEIETNLNRQIGIVRKKVKSIERLLSDFRDVARRYDKIYEEQTQQTRVTPVANAEATPKYMFEIANSGAKNSSKCEVDWLQRWSPSVLIPVATITEARRQSRSPVVVATTSTAAAEDNLNENPVEPLCLASQIKCRDMVSVAFCVRNKCIELKPCLSLFDSGSPTCFVKQSLVPFTNK